MKKTVFSFFLILVALISNAQDSIRVSLLTVGPGHDEIYEPFGHTAVRILDLGSGTDIVYNYGTFNGFEENFELKFMRGQLLYYISAYPYPNFLREYDRSGRSVTEDVFKISQQEAQGIKKFLDENLKPENRGYKYDFFFDNCATRIRDIFSNTYGNRFLYGTAIDTTLGLTFRDIMNQYLHKEHLYRFGINILLGSKIDQKMSNKDIMFLPDYLKKGIAEASLDGTPFVVETIPVFKDRVDHSDGINWGIVVTGSVLILLIIGMFSKQFWLMVLMKNLVFFINSFLGILILIMWFGTDHVACQANYNLLWALPTSFLLFSNKKRPTRYIVIAIGLLILSLIIHITGIQQLPIVEIMPWFLTLLLLYGMIYKGIFQKKFIQ